MAEHILRGLSELFAPKLQELEVLIQELAVQVNSLVYLALLRAFKRL